MISSVYDPLGFTSLFILQAKALFPELCRRKIGWDADLPEDIQAQWLRWLADLPLISSFAIPRCLHLPSNTSSVELHRFSDVSELAYGAVSYLCENGNCRLLMSQSRLAPIQPSIIPCLELLAAVLATDMDQYLKGNPEAPISKTYFWTDSTIVLQYIENTDRRFQTFVENRVSKIHRRSDAIQWRHIGTDSNPADDVSRCMNVKELFGSVRWVSGPEFSKDQRKAGRSSRTWEVNPKTRKSREPKKYM